MQLGASWRPAPTSANSAERSSTRTLTPLRVSANAAERPPMPPPTMMTSGCVVGEPHRASSCVLARLSLSASKTGESLKRNRSSAPESESVSAGLRPGRERLPGGHHEQVAAADRPGRVADGDGAGAVEDGVDRRSGLAGGPGLGVARDPVHFHPDRRQHVAAGGGVGVADGRVAGLDRARVALALQRELVRQRAVGVLPAVGQQRRAGAARPGRLRDRGQAGVTPEALGPGALGRGLLLAR